MLRDRSNGARGQRRRQERRACRRKPVLSDCVATSTRDAWSMRTGLDFCVKDGLGAISSSRCQTTHASQANLVPGEPGRSVKSCFTSGRAEKAAASAMFACLQAVSSQMPKPVIPVWPVFLPPAWWSQTGSNRRPPACKAGALPTELWPLQGSVIRHGESSDS